MEHQRALFRERMAARRTAFTPQKLEQQRAITREKTTAWRAIFTAKEIAQHRALAAERSMSKRATASPIEAEEKRARVRKRSASIRAAYNPEQARQQKLAARKRSHLQKKRMGKQEVADRNIFQSGNGDWPKPIEMEFKLNCLKSFIQYTSMHSLAEVVCGICNIRFCKRDAHRVPVSKIPPIQLQIIPLILKQNTNLFFSYF